MTITNSTDKPERGRRHKLIGIVVSDKTEKTRVITVSRLVRHPKYEKIIRKRKRFYVHDEGNQSHLGDLIEVVATRPISKLKRWRLVRIVKAARRVEVLNAEGKTEEVAG